MEQLVVEVSEGLVKQLEAYKGNLGEILPSQEDRQPIDIIDTNPFKFFVEKTCTGGEQICR